MFSGSRTSLNQVADLVAERRLDPAFAGLAADLYAACDLLDREKSLRQALADSGRSEHTRTQIVRDLLAAQVSALALDVLTAVASKRWSSDEDLVAAVRVLADQAAFIAAADNGTLEDTENEIFQIGRAIAASGSLQSALTDPAISASAKAGIISDLLRGKVTATTDQVVGFTLSHLQGRRVDQAIDELVDLAAAQRQRVVAVVRVARPLDSDLAQRMTVALSALTGRIVTLNVVVDPSVLGGAHVTVAGEVIDGTVATRLANARRAIVG